MGLPPRERRRTSRRLSGGGVPGSISRHSIVQGGNREIDRRPRSLSQRGEQIPVAQDQRRFRDDADRSVESRSASRQRRVSR